MGVISLKPSAGRKRAGVDLDALVERVSVSSVEDTHRAAALRCAQWIKDRVEIRSVKRSGLLHG
eukprot:gene17092-21606_t